jgi:hypothetical protein
MIIWEKLQPLLERKAYRIVQKHIKAILQGIPYDRVNVHTYEATIEANISYEQILEMYKELYTTIGLRYGNLINKEIEKVKKANSLFNDKLLRDILLFLSNEGGVKITSVHDTLIKDVIEGIKAKLGENATIVELRDAIYEIVSKSGTFYKYQALRIARTETTAASGYAAMKTAEQSDLALQKIWIATLDNRTRRDHFRQDGLSVDLAEPFVMFSGKSVRYPGDPKADADEVINCRCTIAFTPKRDADGMLIFKT